jgi:hypothetical protein
LGQGTFGKVVEAIDTETNTREAIKIIRAIPKYRDASRIEIRVPVPWSVETLSSRIEKISTHVMNVPYNKSRRDAPMYDSERRDEDVRGGGRHRVWLGKEIEDSDISVVAAKRFKLLNLFI